jgi:hypothetical protein
MKVRLICTLVTATVLVLAGAGSSSSRELAQAAKGHPQTTVAVAAGPPAFALKWGSLGSGDGQFMSPWGVGIDGSGNVYVADGSPGLNPGNDRIEKFTGAGSFLRKWRGGSIFAPDEFQRPLGVAVHGSAIFADVYVADTSNNRIQRLELGIANGLAVQWGTFGSGNGQFQSPDAVAVDGAGNVYVADTGNDRIQKFSSSGSFLTKWGSTGSGNGQFDRPSGVAVDGPGNRVYVVDQDNNRIQKFSYGGITRKPVSPKPTKKVATTTTVVSSVTSVYGQPVTFTATVSKVRRDSGIPTGTISFMDGRKTLGKVTLKGRKAVVKGTFGGALLPVGAHKITAVYSGSLRFAPSRSRVRTLTVGKADTTTVLVSSANPSVFGQSVTFTATVRAVAPGSGAPKGSVQFRDGGTVVAGDLNQDGVAVVIVNSPSVGTHSIMAVYMGDASFAASDRVARPGNQIDQIVGKAATTTVVVAKVSPTGLSVTFTVTVTANGPGAGTPTGSVQFTNGSTNLGSATLDGGKATLTTDKLPKGAQTITARYNGDSNFAGSSSTVKVTTG